MSGRFSIAAVKNLLRTNPVKAVPNRNAFSIDLVQNCASVIYEYDNGIYDLVHSEIPDEFQGKGLGGILAERVFDHLVENDKKFRLTCDFLRGFYERNASRYSSNVVD